MFKPYVVTNASHAKPKLLFMRFNANNQRLRLFSVFTPRKETMSVFGVCSLKMIWISESNTKMRTLIIPLVV